MGWAGVYVLLLGGAVNGAMLLFSGWLCRLRASPRRVTVASGLAAAYTALCFYHGAWGSLSWRLLCLTAVGGVVFWKRWKGCAVYLLLSLAVDGLLAASWGGVLSLAAVLGLCYFAFRGDDPENYLPVELRLGDRQVKLTALRDTGNTLRDPVTGSPVLILDLEASRQLTGLTREQLQNPVETMQAVMITGLRLLPYQTVGNSGQMLLGLRLPWGRIGDRKGSITVAFAPENFSGNGEFQALAGGMLWEI